MGTLALGIQLICWALIIAIFVRVIFSWIEPYPRNSLYRMAFDITEPLLRPVRNLLPPMAGFDLSPTIVTIVLFMIVGIFNRL
jgi:YggT family protein